MLKSSFLLADEDDKANLLEKLTKELNNWKEKLAKSNIFKEYLRIKGVWEDDKSIHLNEKELKVRKSALLFIFIHIIFTISLYFSHVSSYPLKIVKI